jgi:molybdate transport system substrate-binding protein
MAWINSCLRLALNPLAIAAVVFGLLAGTAHRGAADDVPVVAAASSLRFALDEIAAAFRRETGASVAISYGSSGNLSRQIRQGAPFEAFLSADDTLIDALSRDGFTRDGGLTYARGRLAILVPHGSPLSADPGLDGLELALADGRITRFAIASPAHAPYGMRAEEALRHRGLWEDIEPKLVYGENIAQTAQFATSGDAQGGIVAYALALAPKVSTLGEYALIPEDWHKPLNQKMVLLKNAGGVAEAFFAFMQQTDARAVLEKFGFASPGETS